jgi:hypothetical protein
MADRAPFEPIGEQARWRVIYEALKDVPVGETITYERLGTVLDLDPKDDRSVIQQAMHRAAYELETQDKHAVDSVRGIGYRVVEPVEHMGLAVRQQKRSRRALERGQSKVVNVDLTGMEPEIRKAFEVLATGFALQADFNRRIENRQARLDRALREISDTQDTDRKHSDEEITELRERLARLEAGTT